MNRTPIESMRFISMQRAAWCRRLLVLGGLLMACWSSTSMAISDCNIQLSESTVDYGRLYPEKLTMSPMGGLTSPLDKRSVVLNLSCSQPSDLTLFFKAPAAGQNAFLLGQQGTFSLRIRDALLDGHAVNLGQVQVPGDRSLKSGAASSLLLTPGYGVVPVVNGLAAQGTSFSARVEIEASLTHRAGSLSAIRDETPWVQEGTFDAAGADSSADLTLQGTSLPISCTPSLTNTQIDLGRVFLASYRAASKVTLAHKTTQFAVSCTAPSLVSIRLVDNQPGSATDSSPYSFGLGRTPQNEKIGYYQLSLGSLRGDGRNISMLTGQPGSWDAPVNTGLLTHDGRLHAFADSGSPVASMYSQVAAELTLSPFIDATGFSVREEININGSVTIEVVY